MPHNGACGDYTGGRQAYFCAARFEFLFFNEFANRWRFSQSCGSSAGIDAQGVAGEFPFPTTSAMWECSTSEEWENVWAAKPMSITCSVYDGDQLECLPGTYNSTGYGPNGECTSCPADRPFSDAGATSLSDCLDPSEGSECAQVTVEGCGGTDAEAFVNGDYVPYDGACSDWTAYFSEATGQYIYGGNGGSKSWINPTCGVTAEVWAEGQAGDYPFVTTNSAWDCSDDGWLIPKPTSITCSVYDGDQLECLPGTYNSTGYGPNGECTSCPTDLPLSLPGSALITDCYSLNPNLYVACRDTRRVVALNCDAGAFQIITDGELYAQDIDFITDDAFVIPNGGVQLMDTEGAPQGELVTAGSGLLVPNAVMRLALLDQVVVATGTGGNGKLFFFDLNDYQNGQAQFANNNVGVFSLNSGRVRFMSKGEQDDEILVTVRGSTEIGHSIRRLCVPSTSCDHPAVMATANPDLDQDIVDVAPLREKGTYLVTDRYPEVLGNGKVWECSLDETDVVLTECSTFAQRPENAKWDPFALLVDEVRKIVYVSDHDYHKIHMFRYGGGYLGRLEEKSGDLVNPSSMAIGPGVYPPNCVVALQTTATAGSTIELPLVLRDHLNHDLDPAADHVSRFRVYATGIISGTTNAVTIEGTTTISPDSTLTAALAIPYAGLWEVTATGGVANPQQMSGSPFQITVHPATTDPSNCEAEFDNLITAGSSFSFVITTVDAFGNPTTGAEFEFSCCVSEIMTKAGEYTVHVGPSIKGSPFRFNVMAGTPSASSSEHLVSREEQALELRVFPKDKFNNAITDATDCAVSIDGGDDIPLIAPNFNYTHTIPAKYEGEIVLSFTLGGVDVKDSPVTIAISPPWTPSLSKTDIALIAAGIAALTLLFVFLYRRQRQRAKITESRLLNSLLTQRVKEEKLQMSMNSLQDDLRNKKHSEEELEVMKLALNGLEEKQKDELREVLISSSEVKASRLLGKGGFGVVNLATYRGQQTAMKQLLTINDESVKRFR